MEAGNVAVCEVLLRWVGLDSRIYNSLHDSVHQLYTRHSRAVPELTCIPIIESECRARGTKPLRAASRFCDACGEKLRSSHSRSPLLRRGEDKDLWIEGFNIPEFPEERTV